MRTQPQEIILKLEEDNSRLAKELILADAMHEGLDEFFEGVKMALDPLVTFGVKKVPERNDVLTGQGLSWNNFKTLANQLINRELTGHAARDAIELAMGVATTEQWNMFYRRILIKDLRCGVSEKTVNKIAKEFPQYNIPIFTCLFIFFMELKVFNLFLMVSSAFSLIEQVFSRIKSAFVIVFVVLYPFLDNTDATISLSLKFIAHP